MRDEAEDPRFETSTQLRSLAYHESGHAVIAQALGLTVYYATIQPRPDTLGHVRHAPHRDTTVEAALLITLAGPAAQLRNSVLSRQDAGDLMASMCCGDTTTAHELIRILRGGEFQACVLRDGDIPQDIRLLALARWQALADETVARQWPWIVAVARELERCQTVSGDQIARLNPSAERRQ